MRHLSEDDLVLHHYGETGRPDAAAHLEACDACRRELDILRRTLGAVGALPVPEPGPEYEARVWSALAPRLQRRARWFGWAPRPAPRHLALAASLLVMVMAAFLAGRAWRSPVDDGAIPAEIRHRVLQLAVADHLERSHLMLTELLNGSGADTGPASAPDRDGLHERQRQAQALLAAGRIYRQTAASSGDTALESLLDELERVMLEVAHAPEQPTAAELDALRRRVDDNGILFRIRVIGSQMRSAPRQGQRA